MAKAHAPTPAFIAPAVLLACMLLVWIPSAFALNPSLDVSQYAHTSWKIRDGFFKGQITSIAQTADGYLWLGTEFGLVRFDGVRTVALELPPDQHLPSSLVSRLLVSHDNTLWIGTSKGLVSWKDGRLTQYAEVAGTYIFGLLEDHEGSVWVSGTGRICVIRNGALQCDANASRQNLSAFGLYEDGKHNLWVGVKDGLWRWKPEPSNFYPLPGEIDGLQGFAESDDGVLLFGAQLGIRQFVNGHPELYPLPNNIPPFKGRRLLRDRDGGLWIGTSERGLVHVHQGRTDVFGPSDGLSGEAIYALFEDREANIWVATMNGLDRFRDYAAATITANQGLSSTRVASVLSAQDGSVWLSTRGGLERWSNSEVTTYHLGLNKNGGRGNEPLPNSLFQDHLGRFWLSTPQGFGYFENGRFVSAKGLPGGNQVSIAEDNAGTLWIDNEQVGLLHLVGNEVQQIPWSSLGHKDNATALAADPAQGGLWLGFQLGGIAYLIDGHIRESYASSNGLGQGRVNQLRVDQENTLWVATEGGLSRFKNGHVATLTSKNDLPCDAVHWSIEDDAKSIWLYTACGLVHIARSEVEEWAADSTRRIHLTVFDSSDGVRSLALATHYSPQVAKSQDGRIWFLPWDGVSVVDPRHLPFNRVPPPVHIEQITADRKTYDATYDSNQRLQLPPLIRDLQIDYTALSLVAPEKILFRYKLEGYDSDWQDAGNRRQAFYTNLPPRNYRFRVIACNNSGVWNETGTFIDFTIAPAYYQTTWFRIAIGVVFLIILGAAYQLRVRQVARQVRGRMEERLEERERIARDLHDTLLQSVQGLILKFHAVSTQIPAEAPARAALEKTLDHADQVLAEGRDRIRNLRVNAASLTDLPAAFRSVAEETPQGREAIFKTVVEGHVRDLHPLVLEECYSIGREAIVNALSHSQGQHIEAEIIYDPRQFRLRVRDDGRGIDQKILEDGERPGHWGLQGMRERAQKVGGQLRIWSRPETGTELELTIPGGTAYQGSSTRTKKFWSNLFVKTRGNSKNGGN